MRHVIAGTAGHIDHGKSALVQALTGIDPDRLKEEKQRGITIDLGFAHLDLGDLQIGFVDVPGHERFVKNMLAGIGGIDLVLLVVAADESVMPQTREHFEICRLLGISRGIVVITKTDLAEPDLIELVREEVREMAAGSFLEHAPVIEVSSRTGAGIDRLRTELHTLAASVPERRTDSLLRLPIDRAFSIRGFGTVVTGTMTSGRLQKEEEVELIPGGLVSRVRGIQVHGKMCDEAAAGQRTAVNLQSVDLSQVKRGMVLTVPGLFRPTQLLDVRLTLLPGARALKSFTKVRFHIGTSEVMARVALLGRQDLAPGGEGYAQLRLDAPAFCLHGDPFIIRQFSPAVTIGGGRVLNPHPLKHRVTDRQSLAAVERLADGGMLDSRIPVFVESSPKRAVGIRELNASLGLPEAELRALSSRIAATGRLVVIPSPDPLLVLPQVVDDLEERTVARVKEFHSRNPLAKGISREELRKRIYDDLPPEVFRFCLDDLVEKKAISIHEDMVALYGREVRLSPRERQVQEMIEENLVRAGFQPPLLSELPGRLPANAEEVRRISLWMLKERLLVRVSDDLAYPPSTMERIKEEIRRRFQTGARFGVADFKDLFGLTRKHAIPLLEFLDRERFTRRQGNERILL